MNAKPQKGLGRGLSALIAEAAENKPAARVAAAREAANDSLEAVKIPVTELKPSRLQPRSYFRKEELSELAVSIRKNGVVQPILVRALPSKIGSATHEIIAGERRWRASQEAGLTDIPAIVMDIDDKQALEIALIENIQRQNLTPIEVAEGYQRLIDEFKYTQDQLADVVGKSRTVVNNYLRLLGLPERVKQLVNEEKLSFGHARALITLQDPSELAERVVLQHLSVRQTEALVKQIENAKFAAVAPRIAPPKKSKKDAPISQAVEALKKDQQNEERKRLLREFNHYYQMLQYAQEDEDIADLEKTLSKNLGLNIAILDEGEKGRIVISYDNLNELDNVLRKLEKVASLG